MGGSRRAGFSMGPNMAWLEREWEQEIAILSWLGGATWIRVAMGGQGLD